jgi:23S rRNA pseudouridine1911/1915/1917 synthase
MTNRATPPIRVLCGPAEEGERADVVLGRARPDLSRRVARQLGLDGKLRIDGKRVPPSTRVREGQWIEVWIPSGGTGSDEALPDPVVLRAAREVVYVEKPAGLPTHPLGPQERDALSLRVAKVHPECASASEEPREGGAIHRLDVDTSGVVAFARDRQAWTRGRAAFSASTPLKRYLAVVELPGDSTTPRDAPSRVSFVWPPPLPVDGLHGWLEDAPPLPPIEGAPTLASLTSAAGTERGSGGVSATWPTIRVRAPIGHGPDRRTSTVRLDGRRAISLVAPRLVVGRRALLEVAIETGARHQVRVHLAWLGLPIVGDALYGATDVQATDGDTRPRLALHAASLRLGAAFPEEPWVHAPLPQTLVDLLR